MHDSSADNPTRLDERGSAPPVIALSRTDAGATPPPSDFRDVVSLIRQEMVFHDSSDDTPPLDAYVRRFPQFETELRQYFVAECTEPPRAESSDPSETKVVDSATPPAIPLRRPGGGAVPDRVGDYEVLGILGRGGMGVVYKAWQKGLNRTVALKMLLGGVHSSPSELRRFQTEAEAAARLQHPNIVQIYDVGEVDGRPFLALEYVDGGSLSQRLDGNPQEPRTAAALVETLARAMHYAHERGVVHRDLKPANILLVGGGGWRVEGERQPSSTLHPPPSTLHPKITDFGLAKRIDIDAGQTNTGAVLGTPSYMAPEQAGGRLDEIGPATDVYALGAILYDLLTGRPPFKGTTLADTLEQVRSVEPVSPVRLQPHVPRDLETVCLKCLHKEPTRRYTTAQALAEDLNRFLAGEPVRARRTPVWERAAKWSKRHPARAGLIVVSTATLAGALIGSVAFAQFKANQVVVERGLRKEVEDQRDRSESNYQLAANAVKQMETAISQVQVANDARLDRVRRTLLEKALGFYTELLKRRRDDPAMRLEVASAYASVADIRQKLGDVQAAEADCREAISRFRALEEMTPEPLATRQERARTLQRLATICQAQGRRREAEQAQAEALALRQQLVQEHPKVARYREDLGNTYNDRGNEFQTSSKLADADAAYRQGKELLAQLASEFPNEADYRLDLARIELNRVPVLLASQRTSDAEQEARHAHDLLAAVGARFPDDAGFRVEWIRSCRTLAGVLQVSGKPREAEPVLRRAQELAARLVSKHPTVPEYRHEQAEAEAQLAQVLEQMNSSREAESVWKQAISHRAQLAAFYPTEPVYGRTWALSQQEYAQYLIGLGRFSEAEAELNKAVALQTELVARHAGETAFKQDLARGNANRGALQLKTKRYNEAVDSYARAVTLLVEARAQSGSAGVAQAELLQFSATHARLLAALGRRQQAEQAWQQTVSFCDDATPELPRFLVELARLQLTYDRPAQAARSLDRARNLNMQSFRTRLQSRQFRQEVLAAEILRARSLWESGHLQAAGGVVRDLVVLLFLAGPARTL